jgi:ribosomal protein S18 acetylase RimI-like enzyme
MAVEVYQLSSEDITEAVLDGLNRLLSMVSKGAEPMTLDYLREMIWSPTRVFVAVQDGKTVGMATLAVVLQPVGIVCHVEDVAVDEECRREGIGEKLMAALIFALPTRWRQLDLTSKPEREPAHKLYKKLGFELRETGNYRLKPME